MIVCLGNMEEEDSAPLHHVEELIRGNEDTLFEQAAELTNQVDTA